MERIKELSERISAARAPRGVMLAILCVVGVAQLAFPASQIYQRESVLRGGVEYRFRTIPVDPYDAFRGRYVALGFENADAPMPEEGVQLERRQKVFVPLVVDAEGFATLGPPAEARPAGDYLTLRVRWSTDGRVHFEMPFSRYYMEEKAAPEAERVYRDRARQTSPAYVTVRVLNGRGVLEELYVDDLPIRERLARP